jgi:hypothetical protein
VTLELEIKMTPRSQLLTKLLHKAKEFLRRRDFLDPPRILEGRIRF